ncbi:hypothetical protein [Caballeronia sp. Sq4a]|uniref:hypothetical protein n=1 Tax=Caballeronia sp. Sq4a TaxID=2878152 RepID=UPI0020BE116E|nr:hypothetical protein [Caballeronia sp. Sq4a]
MTFDEWLKRPLASYSEDAAELDAIEDRAQDVDNLRLFYGQLQCRCCVCDEWFESFVGIDELEPIETLEKQYCGGSPRCCP